MYADIFGTILSQKHCLPRSAAWYSSVVYDGGYNIVITFSYHVRKATKPKLLALFIGVWRLVL